MKNDNFDKERLLKKWQLPEDVKGRLENVIEDAAHEDFKSQKIKIDTNSLTSNYKQSYSMTSKNKDSTKTLNNNFTFKRTV
jgi:hypothetical protein